MQELRTTTVSHMVISVDAEKTFDKIQPLFPLNKLRIEREFLIKGIYENLTVNIIFNGKD